MVDDLLQFSITKVLYFMTKALLRLILDKPTHKINPSLLHHRAPFRLLQEVMIYNQGGMYEP